MNEVISKEKAFSEGYLVKKKVYLRPVVRGGKLVKDPGHVAYFQYEGATNWFQLPRDNRGVLVNPFKSEEEKKFFEQELDVDLNVHKKKDNFWSTFFVKVVKDYNLMHIGYEFDLSDPLDNLRYKVAKLTPSIAPKWEDRYKKGEYRFALVDEDYEEAKESTNTKNLIKAYTHFGTIQNSTPKMKEFLGMYLMETKQMKFVPDDSDKEWLQREIKKVIEKDLDTVLKMIDDSDSTIKLLILKATKAGAIVKKERNKYDLIGEGVSYTFSELVDYLKNAEKITADVYLKLKAQIAL